jgi:hypothetical protein
MTLILFFTVTGFLIGLSYVMIKRKIKPGAIFTATFLGLLSAGIWKILKEYSKAKGRRKYY